MMPVLVDGLYLATQRTIATSPPPPPPGTCDPWAPVSLTTLDISSDAPPSTYFGPSFFYSGNWYFFGYDGVAFEWVFSRIPASNYTVGGISTFNIANVTQASQYNLSLNPATGKAYTLSNASGGGHTFAMSLNTASFNAGGVSTLEISPPNYTIGAQTGNMVWNGFYYSIVTKTTGVGGGIAKTNITTLATTVLDLSSLSPAINFANETLTLDSANNRLFLIPGKTGANTTNIITIDLVNFTLGGTTAIDMTAFPLFANISEVFHGANGAIVSGGDLYFMYDSSASGYPILTALDLTSLTITGQLDLGPCPVGIINGIHVAASGNVYILFGSDSGPGNIVKVTSGFSLRETFDLTADVPSALQYSGWAFDGTNTLYAMPATTGGTKTAFRIRPE